MYVPKKTLFIPLDGTVDVSDYLPIIDSFYFQRLDGVKQLDTAEVVYRGAKHSRFEHSIGTMNKFRRMFLYRNLPNSDLNEDELKKVELASLLHDCSHNAYAHLTEVIEKSLTGKSHDDRWVETLEKYFDKPLKECGFSPKDLKEVAETNLKEIIWDIVGVDKLDYIQRDFYHVGFPTIEIEPQLTYSLFLKNKGLCIEEKSSTLVTNFIHAWYVAHSTIYWRKACLIQASMMRRAIWNAILQGSLELEKMREMRDYEVDYILLNSQGKSKKLFKNVLSRNLYKTAVTFKVEGYSYFERKGNKDISIVEVPEEDVNKIFVEDRNFKEILELEKELSKEFGTDVIISTTPQPDRLKPKDPKIFSRDREEVQKLSDINSDFLSYQKKIPKHLWVVRVAVPAEDRKEVSRMYKVVKEYLCP